MKAATLFSGIGSPETAMPGWDWLWHAEIEKFPNAVMSVRHPRSQNLGDVSGKKFVSRATDIGRPNVLIFGSPCQDFSIAGQRLGLDGARGNMALQALAVARELGTEWLVFENVPGMFSSYSGSAEAERALRGDADRALRYGQSVDAQEDSDFAAFLTAVRQCGYLGCWRVLDAQYFGVPQRRRRLFFVARLRDWRGPAAVLFESDSLRGDNPPSREEGEGVTHSVAPSLTSSGRGVERGGDTRGQDPVVACRVLAGAVSSKWSKGTGGPAGDECYNLVPVAFSCKDYGADMQTEHAPTLRAMGHAASHPNAGGQLAVAFQSRIARNGRGQPEDVVPALNGADAGTTSDMRPMVAIFKPSHYTRGKDGEPSGLCPPLTKETDKGDQDPLLLYETVVRRLTPRECERLQGFPDDYTLIEYRGKLAMDGPRYKSLGNSMAVPVMRHILGRLQAVDTHLRLVGALA